MGSPAIAGSAGYSNGVFNVNGAGTDIYGTNDQFNYVYQSDPGDATITARVTSQTNTSSNAKAGVIFKQSTTSGTNYILIAIGPGSIKTQWDFNHSISQGTYTFPNAWVQLIRRGSTFTARISSDGVN